MGIAVETPIWDSMRGDDFLERFEASWRTDRLNADIAFFSYEMWDSAAATVKIKSTALDLLIPLKTRQPVQPEDRCWNCGSTDLWLEPDPTMQGVTDRVRCLNCNENN